MADFNWDQYPVASNEFNWDDHPVVPEQVSVQDTANTDIGWYDRAVAKNFANSPESQAKYLAQEYPGLDVRVVDGEVVARRPGEAQYSKLDPSELEFSDISDLVDVVTGGVASAAGGLAGAAGAGLVTGGAGAIPGYMAGTAVAGAGHESLRQKIGQYLGIPQEVSGKDVAIASAANVLGAGLFGTGSLGQLAVKGSQQGFKTAANVGLKNAETQGLVRAGWNKGAPKMAQFWTGVTPDVLETYTNPVTRQQVDNLSKGGLTDFTDDLVTRVKGALNKEKASVGQNLRSEIDGAGNVNIGEAKKVFEDHISQLNEAFQRVPTNENKTVLDSAKSQYMQTFGSALTPEGPLTSVGQSPQALIPDEMLASDAWRLKDQLKDVGNLRKLGGGISSRHAVNATVDEKALADAGLGAYRAVNDQLDEVTKGASPALNRQYSEIKDLEGSLAPSLRTDQSAYSTFTNLDGKSKMAFREALEKLGKKTGDDFAQPATMLQAADFFGSNSWTPKSITGTTSTTRTLPAVILGGGIGAAIGTKFGSPFVGASIGAAAGGASASPNALKALIKTTDPLRAGADALGRVYAPAARYLREGAMQSPWFDLDRP